MTHGSTAMGRHSVVMGTGVATGSAGRGGMVGIDGTGGTGGTVAGGAGLVGKPGVPTGWPPPPDAVPGPGAAVGEVTPGGVPTDPVSRLGSGLGTGVTMTGSGETGGSSVGVAVGVGGGRSAILFRMVELLTK